MLFPNLRGEAGLGFARSRDLFPQTWVQQEMQVTKPRRVAELESLTIVTQHDNVFVSECGDMNVVME